MQLFATIAIKYLHAPTSIFPFELIRENKYVSMILKDIFEGGDFGFFHPEYHNKHKTWVRRWLIYKRLLRKTLLFASVAPSYTMIIPGIRLFNRFKVSQKS